MFKVGQRVEYIGHSTNSMNKGDVFTVLEHGGAYECGWMAVRELPGRIMFQNRFRPANGLKVAVAKLHDPRKGTENLVRQMAAEIRKSLKSK